MGKTSAGRAKTGAPKAVPRKRGKSAAPRRPAAKASVAGTRGKAASSRQRTAKASVAGTRPKAASSRQRTAKASVAGTRGKSAAPRKPAGREHPPAPWLAATRTPAVVRLPPLACLALEGRGAPESREFRDAIDALFGVGYTLKFALQASGRDFKVPPLEALWWSDADFTRLEDPRALWRVPRHAWRWKLLLVLPGFVTTEDVRTARQTVADKRGGDPLPLRVCLDRIEEGTCVQVLHVGPYADEPQTVRRMQALMKEQGLTPCGFHHEIYLGYPRRAAPEKLRTILRQPVR